MNSKEPKRTDVITIVEKRALEELYTYNWNTFCHEGVNVLTSVFVTHLLLQSSTMAKGSDFPPISMEFRPLASKTFTIKWPTSFVFLNVFDKWYFSFQRYFSLSSSFSQFVRLDGEFPHVVAVIVIRKFSSPSPSWTLLQISWVSSTLRLVKSI